MEMGWDETIRGKPEVGASAELTKCVDARDIELFAQITGDRNPLHFDADAARRSKFGGLIAQGGITSGLLNAVVAEELPGPGTVFLSVEWKFLKPVYVGDSITGRVEITAVRVDKPICTIATSVRNQAGVICLSGTATTYTVALTAPVGESGKHAQDSGSTNSEFERLELHSRNLELDNAA